GVEGPLSPLALTPLGYGLFSTFFFRAGRPTPNWPALFFPSPPGGPKTTFWRRPRPRRSAVVLTVCSSTTCSPALKVILSIVLYSSLELREDTRKKMRSHPTLV